MKNFSLYLASLLLSVFFLTSCVKGSNVTEEIGYGVLDWGGSNNLTPILKSTFGFFYAPNLTSLVANGTMNIGDCYAFYFRIDLDLPENSLAVAEVNGYQTITLIEYAKLSKYYLSSMLTDTLHVLPDEVPVGYVCIDWGYVANHLFLSQTSIHPEDWEISWDMSIDYNTIVKEELGKRYYDLYIRAKVKNQGAQIINTSVQSINAYYIGDYLSLVAMIEQSFLGSDYDSSTSKFVLRLNYVSELNEETNSVTWRNDKIELPVASFLEDY